LDSTKSRIISAAYKAVRQYGLDGVRIQNISQIAGISPGALYRYFNGKDDLLEEAFVCIDKQVADIYARMDFDFRAMLDDPIGAVKQLWVPYFRFWITHPDETVFYFRFRDSEAFRRFDETRDVTFFKKFILIVYAFHSSFPQIEQMNQELLWLHILTSTVMYAKNVVEGVLPCDENTEDTIFQLLMFGLSKYFQEPS